MKVVNNKKIKVYVVGNSVSYASWLNHIIVQDMKEADLVLFTGGEDVNPSLYKQKSGQFTSFNHHRDLLEVAEANKAIALNKKIFGTCRGAQLGCVMSGGVLVQHMNHPYQHDMILYDGTIVQTNSLHHQMQRPFNLHPTKFVLAGYAKSLSNIYLNGEDQEVMMPSNIKGDETYFKEPELVYYRDTKWLGVQGHPEMMPYNSKLCSILRGMVDLLLEDKLDIVLTLSIPTERYVGKPLIISELEDYQYQEILNIRRNAEIDFVN